MTRFNPFKVDTISLKYRPRTKPSERPTIDNSFDAFQVLKSNWSADLALREEFNILMLDNQSHVLGMSNLSKGGITQTIIDIRLAFATALLANSCALILAHNHPSGAKRPSHQDIQMTKKFIEAGNILDIKIHDHIILTPDDRYYSFADDDLYL